MTLLATRGDYEYPNIDWRCRKCDEVYRSSGYPDETRCTNGHGHGWKPDPDKLADYIDTLESLEEGDGVVVCGRGPAPLMGVVESTDESQLKIEEIEGPSRIVQWRGSEEGEETLAIEWYEAGDNPALGDQVYHVETVEVQR